MKKRLLLIFLLPFSVMAQKIDFGINFGANISYVTNDGLTNSALQRSDKTGTGLLLGIYGDYALNNHLILDMDVNYRIKEIETNAERSLIATPKLHFIDFSPNLKYSFGSELKQGFYLGLGPRISILTKSEINDGQEIIDFFNDLTFGSQLVLGQSFNNLIMLQMKLDYEFSNLLKTENPSGKTNSLAIFLSARLNINKLIK